MTAPEHVDDWFVLGNGLNGGVSSPWKKDPGGTFLGNLRVSSLVH